MNRKILLIIALVILVVGAFFVLFPQIDTKINCHGVSKGTNESYIYMDIYYNGTDRNGSPDYVFLGDKAIEVNLTGTDNNTKTYNLITNSSGEARISNLSSKEYNVTAYFAGDNVYKASQWNGTIDLRHKAHRYNGTYYHQYYVPSGSSRYNSTYYNYRYAPRSGGVRYYYYYV